MRLLRINDIDVDIDNETAIGIDFQTYDIKDPGKRFVNISNTFTIPLTATNKAIFGNAQNPQSLSTNIYDVSVCNYWVDNQQLIKNAKCRVEEISDRISLFIFQKADIWDELKSVLWFDFIDGFLDWGENIKGWSGVGITNQISSGSLFVNTFKNNTEGIVLPMYLGNFYDYDPAATGTTLDWSQRIYLFYWNNLTIPQGEGGHFCIYVKSIFEYIEYAFDVDFLTSGGVLPGNIWDDPIANALYVPARDLSVSYVGNPATNLYINKRSLTSEFWPLESQGDKTDKTLYDFVNSFFQHLNILKDELEVDGEDVIRLARFDDLETTAEVIDWSGKLSGIQAFKPMIETIYQNNIIKFKEIYPEGNSLLNSKKLTCLNKNLDYEQDLFEIDAYINSVYDINSPSGEYVPLLNVTESFKTFSFFLHDGLTTNSISVTVNNAVYSPPTQNLWVTQLYIASLYNLDDEYNFYDEIIDYPKVYEAQKWLTLTDLKDFEFFKQYFIRELNGSFFVNKIEGFNPDLSKEPTTIELIRISDRTPIVDPDLDYWTDGVEDAFIDGESDYWF